MVRVEPFQPVEQVVRSWPDGKPHEIWTNITLEGKPCTLHYIWVCPCKMRFKKWAELMDHIGSCPEYLKVYPPFQPRPLTLYVHMPPQPLRSTVKVNKENVA